MKAQDANISVREELRALSPELEELHAKASAPHPNVVDLSHLLHLTETALAKLPATAQPSSELAITIKLSSRPKLSRVWNYTKLAVAAAIALVAALLLGYFGMSNQEPMIAASTPEAIEVPILKQQRTLVVPETASFVPAQIEQVVETSRISEATRLASPSSTKSIGNALASGGKTFTEPIESEPRSIEESSSEPALMDEASVESALVDQTYVNELEALALIEDVETASFYSPAEEIILAWAWDVELSEEELDELLASSVW